jgi:type VI protein secretion system component Hcp
MTIRDLHHSGQSKQSPKLGTRMTGIRATLEANMTRQAADNRSQLIELSELQLDNVVGATKITDKASPKLFNSCATGEHIKTATLTC